ncbi:DUF5701 family protein [Streptomyces sp. YIM 132580]|uniref:DUF5701 family protein n=1 Tax=Streptomyces sp. YIM 132580 TaxID=2691958 RepID=UPI003FCDFA32
MSAVLIEGLGPPGADARTPAIWISHGTGRGGGERRGAPEAGGAGRATRTPGWASPPRRAPVLRRGRKALIARPACRPSAGRQR